MINSFITTSNPRIETGTVNGWQVAAITRYGGAHAEYDNQDAFGFGDRHIAVFDGMGGHAGGQVAARAALRGFHEREGTLTGSKLFDYIAGSVAAEVALLEDPNDRMTVAGATGTIALLRKNGTAWAGAVGDTPAVRLNENAYGVSQAKQLLALEEDPGTRHLTNVLAKKGYYKNLRQSAEVRHATGGLLVLASDGGLDGKSAAENEQLALRAYDEVGDNPKAYVQALFEIAQGKGFPDDMTAVAARYMGQAAVGREAGARNDRGESVQWSFPKLPEILTRKPSRRKLIGAGVVLATTWAAVNGIPGIGSSSDEVTAADVPVTIAATPATTTIEAGPVTTQDPQITRFFEGDGAAVLDMSMQGVPVYAGLGDQEPIGLFDVVNPLSVDEERLMVLCPDIPAQNADDLTAEEVCWVKKDGELHDVVDDVDASDLVTPQIVG